MSHRQWAIVAAGVLILVLGLVPLVVPIFIPWTEVNCRHQDINIKTGQRRETRYLWFLCLSERVTNTPLTVALQGETVDVAPVDAWQRVNTFSPGLRHSPSYTYHGALTQVLTLTGVLSALTLSPERERAVAERILSSWQLTGGVREVEAIIREVAEEIE